MKMLMTLQTSNLNYSGGNILCESPKKSGFMPMISEVFRDELKKSGLGWPKIKGVFLELLHLVEVITPFITGRGPA